MADNDNNGNNNSEYFEERAGTEEARYHVVPHEEGWAVKKEGKDQPESTYKSKSEAVDEGKRLAQESETMVYIHSDEGQIEDQENYKK